MPFLLPSRLPVPLNKPVLPFCWLAWNSARPSSPYPPTSLKLVWLLTLPYWVTVLGVLGKYLWEAEWLYYCLNEQIACEVPRFWTLLFCHPFTLLCAPFLLTLSTGFLSIRNSVWPCSWPSGLFISASLLHSSLWLAHLWLSSSVWFRRWVFVLAKRSVIEIWLPLGRGKQLFNWHAVYPLPHYPPHSGVYLWVTLKVLNFPHITAKGNIK